MMRGVMAGAALLMIAMVPAKAQDVAAGERSWAKCRVCHQIGENAKNAVGPHLNGMFGRQAGTVEGYNYSAANKASGITWTDEVFAEYIRDPRAKIPGTKMVFAGIKNDKEIADLTAFIKQFGPDGKKQ
jgi:cytochrome c